MLELLNRCGIQVTGDLYDGKWHMAKYSCKLVPEFSFMVRIDRYENIVFCYDTHSITADVSDRTLTRPKVQEITFALGQVVASYIRGTAWEKYHA